MESKEGVWGARGGVWVGGGFGKVGEGARGAWTCHTRRTAKELHCLSAHFSSCNTMRGLAGRDLAPGVDLTLDDVVVAADGRAGPAMPDLVGLVWLVW